MSVTVPYLGGGALFSGHSVYAFWHYPVNVYADIVLPRQVYYITGLFSDDSNEVKLSAKEQLYARAFHLRSRRKFDDAQKLQSLVDSLCNGL